MNEMTDYWNLDGLPPRGASVWLWLTNDSIRQARNDWVNGLIFTDCTEPHQNIVCDESRVMGWRLASGELAPPPTPAQVQRNIWMQSRSQDAWAKIFGL